MAKISVQNLEVASLIDLKIPDGSAAAEGKVYYISANNQATLVTDADHADQKLKALCLETVTDANLDKTADRQVSFLRKGRIRTDTVDTSNKPAYKGNVYVTDTGLLSSSNSGYTKVYGDCIQGELSSNWVIDLDFIAKE